MKLLRVMDSSGDAQVKFDEQDSETASTLKARALFERMTGKGAAVFAINRAEGQPDKRVRDFSELEQDNLIVPAIVGG
jgi:4-diphosphocytidyl-2C-methyl-D-erythritol kinase